MDPDPNQEKSDKPSPDKSEPESENKKMHQMEFEARLGELDLEDAEDLVKRIIAKL